jgi:CheY-like chemotaxis protein
MQMPDTDGLTVARKIRELRGARELPIVFLSSLGRREVDVEDIQPAAHLTKPLKPAALLEALLGVFAQRPSLVPAEAALQDTIRPVSEAGAAARPRILIAEDNATNQRLALLLLGRLGYAADVVSNGLEVLAAMERQPYDIVMMDVLMPEIDGLDATRRIRARWSAPDHPYIIALTAVTVAGTREECLAAGMNDYIGKPIRTADLVAALERAQAVARTTAES